MNTEDDDFCSIRFTFLLIMVILNVVSSLFLSTLIVILVIIDCDIIIINCDTIDIINCDLLRILYFSVIQSW